MNLPEGYTLERDPDVWTLYEPNGGIVTRFVVGAPDEEIERAALEQTMYVTVGFGLLGLSYGQTAGAVTASWLP